MTFDDEEIVMLECTTEGGPVNFFQWSIDGAKLMSETSSILILSNVTAEDGGAYTGNITNAAGSDTDTTYVFISPMITMNPNSVSVENGTSEVTFICNATGFPEPFFEWMREDGFLPMAYNTTSLTIAPVTFGDEGLYYCVAISNDLQVESERATLFSKKDSNTLMLLSKRVGTVGTEGTKASTIFSPHSFHSYTQVIAWQSHCA